MVNTERFDRAPWDGSADQSATSESEPLSIAQASERQVSPVPTSMLSGTARTAKDDGTLAPSGEGETPTHHISPRPVLEALEDQLAAVFRGLEQERRIGIGARPGHTGAAFAEMDEDAATGLTQWPHGRTAAPDMCAIRGGVIASAPARHKRGLIGRSSMPIVSLAALLASGAVAYTFVDLGEPPKQVAVTEVAKDQSRVIEPAAEWYDRLGQAPQAPEQGAGSVESEMRSGPTEAQRSRLASVDSSPGGSVTTTANLPQQPSMATDIGDVTAQDAGQYRANPPTMARDSEPAPTAPSFEAAFPGKARQWLEPSQPSHTDQPPESGMGTDDAPAAREEAPILEATTPARAARVTTHVNMRAGPDNDAAVLTVVPAGEQVNVVACDYWCEVIFDGQQGWIYKGFIAGIDTARASEGPSGS